jgi:hypothetical protein
MPPRGAGRQRGPPMAPGATGLGQASIRGQKTLRRPGGFASLPTRLALACGPRRVRTAGMELTPLTEFHAGPALVSWSVRRTRGTSCTPLSRLRQPCGAACVLHRLCPRLARTLAA